MAADNQYSALLSRLEPLLAKTARFVPAVFHLHSIDSHDWGDRSKADKAANGREHFDGDAGPNAYLDRLVAAGIKIACVTDHMRCGYACRLARAAQDRSDIAVFPGMELNVKIGTSSERVHLLAVFPPEKTPSQIDRIFAGQRGMPSDEDRSGQEELAVNQLSDLSKRVSSEDGWLIVAHIDERTRGHRAIFRASRRDTARMFLWDQNDRMSADEDRRISEEYKSLLLDSGVKAVEVMKPEDDAHYVCYVGSAGRRLRMPCVIRCDAHCVEDFGEIEKHTFVKVSESTFRKVGEALQFFETRVRFKKSLAEAPIPRLLGLRIRGPADESLFRDVTVGFNENLNCLIGPRSSGKSTIIEAIRFLFGRSFSSAMPVKDLHGPDFQGLSNALQASNLKDSLLEAVWQKSETEKVYLSASFEEDSFTTQVFDASGNRLEYDRETFIEDFPIRICSWSEIEHLGRSSANQRELIDRMLEDLPGYQRCLHERLTELKRNREQISTKVDELESYLKENGGLMRRYVQFKGQFDRLNRPEVETLFKHVDESRSLLNILAKAKQSFEALREAPKSMSLFDTKVVFTEITGEDSPEQEVDLWTTQIAPMLRLSELTGVMVAAGKSAEAAIDERIAAISQRIAQEQKTLTIRENEVRGRVSMRPEERVQTGQRETAKKRLEDAGKIRSNYQRARKELETLLATRKRLLDDALRIQHQISGARSHSRDSLLARLNTLSPDLAVTIEFDAGADRREAVLFLESNLDRGNFGQYRKGRLAQRCFSMINPIRLSRAIFNGTLADFLEAGRQFADPECLDEVEAQNLINAFRPLQKDEQADVNTMIPDKLELLLELQEQRWDDRIRIKRGGKPIDELSPGGRSSVILPLLALAEKIPLVIDQPEDNLDNRMVGNTLTGVFSMLKEVRQLIVATHNPNIVVGGDAEQVIVMDPVSLSEAKVSEQGCIDDENITKKVLAILEGGAEAFLARNRRYGNLLDELNSLSSKD
jgi:energy-coupling factor transporter ATP-binding protein EcfA2